MSSGVLAGPLPVVTVAATSMWGSREAYGAFECWTCAACGLTELYATVERVVEAARAHPDRVRVVDASAAGQGPFR